MKTNIQSLMNRIAEETKNLNVALNSITGHIVSVSTEEIDGRENKIDDNKKEFDRELKTIEETTNTLIKLKTILYEKNNSLLLTDGRTIQEAIIENTNLRKLKEVYESMLKHRSRKVRISEYHDAYFECKKINFDKEEISKKLAILDQKIQETDFEISKLNSEEFEIEI